MRRLLPALALLSLTACERPATAIFRERAEEVGLRVEHDNGMSGELYIVEVIGPGGALFDYDGDGDLDLFAVGGGSLSPAADSEPSTDRLFRNDLDSEGELRFTEVEAQLGPAGYGMGAAAGDFDRDGRVDLYVTRFGPNLMLRNLGDGRFEDVTESSDTDDLRWSAPALFFDYDADGRLDLFVGNYVDFRFSNHRKCLPEQGFADYCSPLAYAAEPDRLFRNRGDGSFEDVTGPAGLQRAFGNALGAIATDVDGDGDLDLYVANDWTENQLWINGGDGTFTERALVAGAALSIDGQPEASMGVLAEDFDGDGDDDLFLTHLMGETNTLYRNAGDGSFEDESIRTGLGEPSWDFTGFGAAAIDYDNDGRLDVFVANGAVRLNLALVQRGDPSPLRQRDQLFRNLGDGRFAEVDEPTLAALSAVGRGVAAGDLDNDGDTDLVVFNNGGPLHYLENAVGQANDWVGFRVTDRDGIDALGARVGLVGEDGAVRTRQLRTGGSYLSSSDPRVLFGLGPAHPLAGVTVRVLWPDGEVEQWREMPLRRYSELRRGSGKAP